MLRQLHGDGTVRLIDAYRERGALLLERLEPGTPLSSLADEDEANRSRPGCSAACCGRRCPATPSSAPPTTRCAGDVTYSNTTNAPAGRANGR